MIPIGKRYNTPHRSHVVKTRMTEEEYADFTERLKNYDMSQAEFIRQAITRATIRPIVTVSPVNDELLSAVGKLIAEYGKIGGNLNQIARALNEYGTPYPHSAAYAREHRELEQYRVSNNVNLQCKESIEAAVREHFDGMYLSHDAAKGVIETYGMERVSMVLSNTVQLQDWDGRYSRRNKEWAKTIPNDNPETVRCGYALNSHPAVLDGFIDLVREEQQRSRTQGEKIQPSRPSVRDKLKQELPAHKPAAPKKQGPER